MLVRVGSETHLIPETQAGYFRRAPSAPFMNLDQHNSRQYISLDLRLQVEGSASLAPFGQWAPDSSQVLGIKQQEASDMQVCVQSMNSSITCCESRKRLLGGKRQDDEKSFLWALCCLSLGNVLFASLSLQ